jgi:hypothetical protein
VEVNLHVPAQSKTSRSDPRFKRRLRIRGHTYGPSSERDEKERANDASREKWKPNVRHFRTPTHRDALNASCSVSSLYFSLFSTALREGPHSYRIRAAHTRCGGRLPPPESTIPSVGHRLPRSPAGSSWSSA